MGDAGRAAEGFSTGGLSEVARGIGGAMGSTDPTRADLEVPGAARPYVNQAGQMIDQFKGMTLDPRTYMMTPMQSGIQQNAMNILGPGGPIGQGSNTLSRMLSPGFSDPRSNPNLASVLGLANQQFTQGMGQGMDMLGSQWGMAGMTPQNSGTFMNSANQLMRSSLNDYGMNVGNILANQYNTGNNQQLQALSMLGMPGSALSGMGTMASLPQILAGQQQQGQLALNQMPFDMTMQLLQGMPLGYPSYGPSPFSQNMGALGSILGGSGQFASGIGSIMAA